MMTPFVESRGLRQKAGFTLLEVLVALVVLSIGLLGLSGLQTSSLRNNHSAFLRSQATIVTNDIIDRMRANSFAAVNGHYDVNYSGGQINVTCTNGSGASGACTAAESLSVTVAQTDIDEWRTYVGRLPGGDSKLEIDTVTLSGVDYDIAEITVKWLDARDAAGTELEVVTRAQL